MTDDIDELNVIVNQINRKHGRDVLKSGKGFSPRRISTGSISLDKAIGGGWPMGRMAVVWGNRSATKSTLCLWSIANAQKEGLRCLYIDTEKTFDSDWAENNGVDTDKLIIMRENTIEQILDGVKELMDKKVIDVIVLDSINSANTNKFFQDGNNSIGIHARSMSELLTKINAWNENTLILLISQARTKMAGVYAYLEYSGGLAMDYYPSIIVKLFSSRDPDSITYEETTNNGKVYKEAVAQKIKWEITKSKISLPHQSGSYTYFKKGGIDQVDEIIELSIQNDSIKKAGAWYYIGDEKMQGSKGVREFLKEHPDILKELRDEIFERG